MFSKQCNEFVLLGVDPVARENVGAGLRARAIELAIGDPSIVGGLRDLQVCEQWDAVNAAIAWLLPRANDVLQSAGLSPLCQDQIRQALFATSSTRAITLETVGRVLGVDPEALARIP